MQTSNPFEQIDYRFDQLERTIVEKIEAMRNFDQNGMDLKKYIPLSQVAEILNVDRQTLYKYKGVIDQVNRFGQIYFLKESLEAFMSAGKTEKPRKMIGRTKKPKM